MISIFILVAGFVLLVKGADFFVEGASAIARRFGIPSIIIGLTIVALGTSLPELAVSVTAALKESNDIALGNVTGSNLVNLLVVVGLAAVIRPMCVERAILKRDYTMALLLAVLVFLLSLEYFPERKGARLTRLDGFLLLAVLVVYMYRLIKGAVRNRVAEQFGLTRPLPVSIFLCLAGSVSIVAGGQMVVDSASRLAYRLGMSETLVGLTIVAIGTSLPELVTSVVAAKKGESEIALGNVLGSNILNIGFILGVSSVIHPITVGMQNLCDILILILVTLVFFIPLWRKERASRMTGALMLLTYLAYTVYIIVR